VTAALPRRAPAKPPPYRPRNDICGRPYANVALALPMNSAALLSRAGQ
jgi:hypothetical protein